MRTTGLISLVLLPLALAVVAACAADQGGKSPEAFPAVPSEVIENVHKVTDKVISGAAPENEEAFRLLHSLGIKTIISVDGAKPDVEAARKYGMRYVHLPIGYDDVTPEEGRSIARAIDELDGPVYVHCHHGKHRSAAAVAVACVMNGRLRPEQAESVLKTFGTGENYKGLWASARAARPLDKQVLRDLKVDYRETAAIPPMAEAMVAIDQTWDRLKLAEKAGWRSPAVHPDIDPAHEALQLMEKLREMGRTDAMSGRPERFREMLAGSEAAAETLHTSLTAWSRAGAVGAPPQKAAAAMKTLGASCATCHKSFRD
jgi:protein tyrosine phosphatase (PTP) superfamily phosphohydrolase (DUF442 family)